MKRPCQCCGPIDRFHGVEGPVEFGDRLAIEAVLPAMHLHQPNVVVMFKLDHFVAFLRGQLGRPISHTECASRNAQPSLTLELTFFVDGVGQKIRPT